MYRAPTGRTRSGPGGFVAVPQLDATEDDAEVRDPEQEPPRRTAQDRFRDRVQHVLRQSTSPQDSAHSSLQSSPALSDTTLVENEYFLQFDRQFYDQQFDEVDIGDYVENHGYYAPEVVSFASIKSLELGQGLEVRIKETPCDYTPGGLYCDGPPAEDLSYKGSDGLSEKLPATGFAPDYDYKPLSLRWRFLLSLCAALAALLALAVLALQVLPDASLANSVAPSSLNTTEIRVRSVLLSSSGVVDDEDALPLRARENGTDSGSTGPEAGTTGVAITSNPTSTFPLSTTEVFSETSTSVEYQTSGTSISSSETLTVTSALSTSTSEVSTSTPDVITTTPETSDTTSAAAATTAINQDTSTTETQPASPTTSTGSYTQVISATTAEVVPPLEYTDTPSLTSQDQITSSTSDDEHSFTPTHTPGDGNHNQWTSSTTSSTTDTDEWTSSTTSSTPQTIERISSSTTTSSTAQTEVLPVPTTVSPILPLPTTVSPILPFSSSTNPESPVTELPGSGDTGPGQSSPGNSGSGGSGASVSTGLGSGDPGPGGAEPTGPGQTGPKSGDDATSTHSQGTLPFGIGHPSSTTDTGYIATATPTTTLPDGPLKTMPGDLQPVTTWPAESLKTMPGDLQAVTSSSAESQKTLPGGLQTVTSSPGEPLKTLPGDLRPATTSPAESQKTLPGGLQPVTTSSDWPLETMTDGWHPDTTSPGWQQETTSPDWPLQTSPGGWHSESTPTTPKAAPYSTSQSLPSPAVPGETTPSPHVDQPTPGLPIHSVSEPNAPGIGDQVTALPDSNPPESSTYPESNEPATTPPPSEPGRITSEPDSHTFPDNEVTRPVDGGSPGHEATGTIDSTSSPTEHAEEQYSAAVATTERLVNPGQNVDTTGHATTEQTQIDVSTPSPSAPHVPHPPQSTTSAIHAELQPFTTITKPVSPTTPLSTATTTFLTSATRSDGTLVQTTMTSVVIVGGQKGYDGDGLTQYTKETTEANGVVVTEMPQAFALISTSIGRNAEGVPTSTYLIEVLNSPMETVLTNAQGQATATLDYYLVSGRTETARTATLRNAEGVATATTTFLVPVTSQTTVYMPAPTSAQPTAPTDEETLRVVGISHGRSFAGLVLPVLLAIAVSIPVRILDQNVKLYAGFHALVSSPGGATASQSLCLETTGFGGLLSSAQSLVGGGHYMLTLTGSLVVLSALAIPFSAEVFRVVLHGEDCQHLATTTTTTTATGLTCSLTIGVSPIPAKVMLALLTAMLVGAAAAAAILRRWHIGVSENPWSIFYMAGLAVDPSVKSILSRLRPRGQGIMGHHADIISNQRIRRADILKALGDKTFVLSEWTDREGRPRYGVRIADPVGQPLNNNNTKAGRNNKQVSFEEPDKAVDNDRLFPHCENMPFFILTWLGRILFLLLLGAVMIAVLTYNIAVSGSEHGQRLADRAVGVRFLFTGAGVLVSLVWGSFFYAVSFASPHALLHSRRPNGSHGLYTSPPTHALAGLRYALGRMHRSAYLGAVAAAAVLAELLLPLLLSSIVPVQHEQQLAVAVWCTWASVALLGGMMLAVAASFVVDWPRLPLDPSTILGAMWYGNYHLVSRSASPGDLFPRHVRRTMPV